MPNTVKANDTMPSENYTHTNTLTGWFQLSGIAILYALLVYIGERYFESDAVIGYFEPASGLALAALLLGGKRYAWSVLLGSVLILAIMEGSLWKVVSISLGDTLQVLCGAWLLTRNGKFDSHLRSLNAYLRLILLGGCASIFIGALAANTALLVFGVLSAEHYFYGLLQWWMSDTLGVILIAPLVLVWWEARNDRRKIGQITEAVLLFGLTILVGGAVFLDWWHDVVGFVAQGYWMFLIVTWAAVRLGARAAMIVLVMTATYALLGAIRGIGFFADDIAQTHLINYWFYMAILSVVGMALATYFAERKCAEDALRIAATAFESQESMVITDINGVIMRVNQAFTETTGYTAEEAVGQTTRLLKSGRHDADFYREMWKIVQRDGKWQGEIWDRRKNGEIYPKLLTISAVKGRDGITTHYVGADHDITKRKAAEKEINNLAFYDSLTRLPNRRLLNDRLGKAMAASKRSGRYGAVMFLDLDNFKPLNDLHGHNVGDLLLIEVARRIASCVREMDTVGRFGGDEFVVLLSELDEGKAESITQAGIVAEKIRASLNDPYVLKVQYEGKAEIIVRHHCTSSIGVVMFVNHESGMEDILKCADMAMYQAKEAGRNLIRFYEPEARVTKGG
ncbi:MAG: diguanylate cyclase [Gallionella sp.]|nr:diguanylate cyclase [Gallionella sp.]